MNAGRIRGQWWGFAAVFVLGNGLIYTHLANKVDILQQSVAEMSSRLEGIARAKVDADSASGTSASPNVPLIGSSRVPTLTAPSVSSPTKNNAMEAVNRILELKQRRSSVDPVTMAADLSNRMAQEPALPEIEDKQSSWLNDTLRIMPADSPEASNLQVSCKGQRCLVSAAFGSNEEARSWSRRYLLKGGGKLLHQARTVVVPLGGTDPSVVLQLYFY